jgi:hypothetical protein
LIDEIGLDAHTLSAPCPQSAPQLSIGRR